MTSLRRAFPGALVVFFAVAVAVAVAVAGGAALAGPAKKAGPPKKARITSDILLALSKTLPPDTWLEDVKAAAKGEVQITGRSMDYAKVSDLMRELDKSGAFAALKLESTNSVKDETGADLTQFKITAMSR